MKKTMSIAVFCVILLLMIMPASIAYAHDADSTVVAAEMLPQVTVPMEDEVVPETCHPQVDNV